MSLQDFTPEIESILRNGPLEYARIIDIYLDSETLYYWDQFHPLTLDDGQGAVTYEPVGGRIVLPSEITEDQSLDGDTIEIQFDSTRAADNSDFVGRLVDSQIVQRRIRIRSVLFRPNTNKTVPIWLFNEQQGVVDELSDRIAVGSPSTLTFSISSGTFEYLERRESNYTPAHQRLLYSGDTSLDRLAQLSGLTLRWGG